MYFKKDIFLPYLLPLSSDLGIEIGHAFFASVSRPSDKTDEDQLNTT